MALPLTDHDDRDDDLLPPELTIDGDEPVSEEALDAYAELVAKVADSVGCSRDEAAELLWDHDLDLELPEGYEVPPLPAELEAFGRAVDEETVDWAMSKLARVKAALDGAKAKRDAYRDRIETWYQREARRLEVDKGYFSSLIEAYARARRTDKVKSWNLPTGTVSSRTQNKGGKLTITDEAALLTYLQETAGAEWLQEQIDTMVAQVEATMPGLTAEQVDAVRTFATTMALHLVVDDPYDEAVKVTRKPMVSKIESLVVITDARATDPETGAIVPGVGVEPESVTYTIKPS